MNDEIETLRAEVAEEKRLRAHWESETLLYAKRATEAESSTVRLSRELEEARKENERLTNKLNADSQNFELECRKAEVERLTNERAAIDAEFTAYRNEREPAYRRRAESAEAEVEALRVRLRETAQILIASVGADGPCDAEDVARRAVVRLSSAEAEAARVRTLVVKVVGVFSKHAPQWEHDGDDESGQHDEDCRACEYEALLAELETALSSPPPDAGAETKPKACSDCRENFPELKCSEFCPLLGKPFTGDHGQIPPPPEKAREDELPVSRKGDEERDAAAIARMQAAAAAQSPREEARERVIEAARKVDALFFVEGNGRVAYFNSNRLALPFDGVRFVIDLRDALAAYDKEGGRHG